MTPRLHRAPVPGVQRFNGVGRADHASDFHLSSRNGRPENMASPTTIFPCRSTLSLLKHAASAAPPMKTPGWCFPRRNVKRKPPPSARLPHASDSEADKHEQGPEWVRGHQRPGFRNSRLASDQQRQPPYSFQARTFSQSGLQCGPRLLLSKSRVPCASSPSGSTYLPPFPKTPPAISCQLRAIITKGLHTEASNRVLPHR
jgi:hypothetical protein